jgi:hypothetical protein
LAGAFLRTLGRALLGALGRRSGFFAFFLLLFDHLDLARGSFRAAAASAASSSSVRGAATAMTEMCLSPMISVLRRFDLAQVNGLANLEVADIHRDQLRQILGQSRAP